MLSNSQSEVLYRTRAAARYLKQLPTDAAAGLLGELATPLSILDHLASSLDQIDWQSLNVSLQRIEFFHVLRTGVVNQDVDELLIALSNAHNLMPSWVQQTYFLSERASALLARQRGIQLDSFDPNFRPPRHLLPPRECLKVAVEVDREFKASASPGHLVASTSARARERSVSGRRRRSRIEERSKGPLHVTRHRLAQRNLETSGASSASSECEEEAPEQAARRKSIDSVSAWLDRQASLEAEEAPAQACAPDSHPPDPRATGDALKLALTAAAASSFSAAASMTFLMCAQQHWR